MRGEQPLCKVRIHKHVLGSSSESCIIDKGKEFSYKKNPPDMHILSLFISTKCHVSFLIHVLKCIQRTDVDVSVRKSRASSPKGKHKYFILMSPARGTFSTKEGPKVKTFQPPSLSS
jgi:hypothetical protein